MKFREGLDRSLKKPLFESKRLLVRRDRLLEQDVGLPILVIEGPSGFGKTVLAETWLTQHRQHGRCCWIHLDKSAGDPITFMNKVLEALGAEAPGNEEVGIDGAASKSERFSNLCSHLAGMNERVFIVFDDVHAIADRGSRVYLEKLLRLASSNLFICLTMQPFEIELGLSKHAAEGKVTWIQADSLAMTRDEVRELSWLRGRVLNDGQLDSLYRVTEGWPALTQIALVTTIEFNEELILRDAPGAVPLKDYIYKRFIQTLSEDDREVLWTLACIGSAPVSLLVALNPPASKVDLAILHFRALGLVQNRDPDDSSTVCLHALIKEVSLRLLDREAFRGRPELIRAAAEWKWAHGQTAAAVGLVLEAGVELAGVAKDWIKSLGFGFVFRTGQHQTLLDLVERWEQVTQAFDDEIDSIAAWALIFQRQFGLAEFRMARIAQSDREPFRDILHLQKTVIAGLQDDFVAGKSLSQEWIQRNEGQHSLEMGIASTVLAFSLKFSADFDLAQVALRDAMYGFNTAQSSYGIGWAHVINAIVLIQSGRYRAALAQIDAGLARCPSSQGFGSLRTLLRAQEAFLRYERNELDRVREILGEVLPLLSDQGIVDAVCMGYAAAARARVVNGDYGTALDILSEGELIALQRDFPRLNASLRAERALLLVRSGVVSQAKPVLESIPESYRSKATMQLLKVRIAIADGDGACACEILDKLVPYIRKQGRQSRLCEALLLLALAHDLRGKETAALAALGEALEIGSVEGYLRTFLDEGSIIVDMIQRWLSVTNASIGPAVSLARQLVAMAEPHAEATPRDPLLTNLNKRERQILSLLNEGLSNAQLAQRCFISEGTVKWYLHNLYEKFEVGNRTALLRVVREKGV